MPVHSKTIKVLGEEINEADVNEDIDVVGCGQRMTQVKDASASAREMSDCSTSDVTVRVQRNQ